jgi:hypothetical protein
MNAIEGRADEARAAIRAYARRVQQPDRSGGIDRQMIAAAVLPPFGLALASLGMVGNSVMAALLALALGAWSIAAERTCRALRLLAGVVPPVVIAVAVLSSEPLPPVFGGRFLAAAGTMSSIGEWTLDVDLGFVRPTLSWPEIWRRTITIEARLAQLLL